MENSEKKTKRKRPEFKVTINFKETETTDRITFEQSFDAEYRFSRNIYGDIYKDRMTFNRTYIEISGTRSGKPDFDEVLTCHKSEIYFQIVRSVCYYYISTGCYSPIEKISVRSGKDAEKHYQDTDINQISSVSSDFSKFKKISTDKLRVIFEGDGSGNSYLYAATNILRSACLENPCDSFEKLWKAYNSIYKLESGTMQDKEALRYMRNQIISNPDRFPLSLEYVDNLTTNDIKVHTQWFAMLENDFSKQPIDRFSGWITRNMDRRISELTLPCIDLKSTFWDSAPNERTERVEYLNNTINDNNKNNDHVLATLCNVYMYFLRNKNIHGEKNDSAFRFIRINKEHEGIKWCNKLLVLYITDLINSHTVVVN